MQRLIRLRAIVERVGLGLDLHLPATGEVENLDELATGTPVRRAHGDVVARDPEADLGDASADADDRVASELLGLFREIGRSGMS